MRGKACPEAVGGGAVYHDDGNLNFTFLMRKEDYDFGRQLEVILSAVKSLGIHAEKAAGMISLPRDESFQEMPFTLPEQAPIITAQSWFLPTLQNCPDTFRCLRKRSSAKVLLLYSPGLSTLLKLILHSPLTWLLMP